ncbi:solute carrier family 2, facilitated glucose transporter member 3 [Trichonephila inaurata madagascariensis]|uniref:Solute carrier family 2, facilitated glucose transporter member 3 n=1 Tax=Trichonephila inaurata madagascariensis TaxID=2747483 RepID=A0A8X6Y3Y3_9ARAC|nr:solute carrier family 2, facilitated glucose transporter member 3 [Trichonephila inaurata madagascariensis]
MPHLRTPGLTGHLVFAIAAAAFGSSFQHGYNTGVVNAPQRLVEKFINETYFARYNEVPNESVVTIIFSVMVSIFCLGGMIGALGTAFFAEKFGRKGGLLLNNIFVFIAAALMGFGKMAKSYEMLIIGRFVIGLNSGLNAGLSPMYLTEISPVHLRGAVGTIYQLIIAFTILISQILGMPGVLGTEEGWPVLFGLIIIPAIFMLVTLPLCPESPKYILICKGKDVSAQKALKWFRGTGDVHYEMDEMRAESQELKLVPKVTLKEMWENALSGINAIIFYSTSIFMNAGGAKNFTLDWVDRNDGYHSIAYISLALTPNAAWLSYLSVICIIGFIILFASGPGSIPWFLVAELFGQGARPIATSIAVSGELGGFNFLTLGFLPIVVNCLTFYIKLKMNTVRNHFFPVQLHSDNSRDGKKEHFCGKWLLFNDKEQEDEARGMTQHDYAWQVIKRLVEKDELYGAKCSTAWDGQYATRPGNNLGVICCYTFDYTNKPDIKRVADAIRRVYCYPRSMFYKTDTETLAGRYRHLGDRYVSIYKHTVNNDMYERDSVIRNQWNKINL